PLFLFIFPILVACLGGGLGPGLLATGLSLLFVDPPDLTSALSLGFMGAVFSVLFDRARKAIKALIEGPRLVPTFIDTSPSRICICDLRARKTVLINRALADALGSVTGQEPSEAGFIRVIHPDDWQPFLDHVQRFSSLGDDETTEFEFRLRHSSGRWRWF